MRKRFWTRSFAQNLLISKFLKIRLSVTRIKYLTSKLVGSLVGHRKKVALCDFGEKLKLQLCGELRWIIEVLATEVLKNMH